MASDRESKVVSQNQPEVDESGPNRLALTFHSAIRALERLLIAQTRASEQGMLEFLVLARVAESDGITPGDVGRSLGLSTGTMTGVVDRLAGNGLVRPTRRMGA